MAPLKDKVGHFFAWALKSKDPVSVEVSRRGAHADDPEHAVKEVSLQQVKQGYGEVVETMQSVRTHLQQQADRGDQMLELLGGLPELMKSLPEQAHHQAGMLEAIHRHLDDQNQTARQLTEAIAGLATASSHQQRSLTAIDQHLAEGHESRSQLNQGVAALTGTLGEVKDSNAATRASMGAVVEQTRVNDERMREMFQRSQKLNTMMVILCLALATGALALGGYMAVLVSRVVDQPTPVPAATAPPAPLSAAPGPIDPIDPGDPGDAEPAAPDAAVDASVPSPAAGWSPRAYRVTPAPQRPEDGPAVEAEGQPASADPSADENAQLNWVGPPKQP